jgi:hypothetical protein
MLKQRTHIYGVRQAMIVQHRQTSQEMQGKVGTPRAAWKLDLLWSYMFCVAGVLNI